MLGSGDDSSADHAKAKDLDTLLFDIQSAIEAYAEREPVDHIIGLIKQVDCYNVHIDRRKGVSSHAIRIYLVQKMFSTGCSLAELAEAVIANLPRGDLEALLRPFLAALDRFASSHELPRLAVALLGMSKRTRHNQLTSWISRIDGIIMNTENGGAVGEVVFLIRATLKNDPKLLGELWRQSRNYSLLSALVLVGYSTTAFKQIHTQYLQDTNVLRCFGLSDQQLIDFPQFITKLVSLIDDHDESAILMLLQQVADLPAHIKAIVFGGLLEKRLSRDVVAGKILWPVRADNYELLDQLVMADLQRVLVENARLLVEIGRQDCLHILVKVMTFDSVSALFGLCSEEIQDAKFYVALISKNSDQLVELIKDRVRRLPSKNDMLHDLLRLNVQNKAFASLCLDMFFEQAGTDSVGQVPWIGICNSPDANPYFLLGCSMNANCDRRVAPCLDALCEFLTCHAEYPNDSAKLSIIICAFTLCVQYRLQKNLSRSHPDHLVGKLIKRRNVLRSKVITGPFNDYILSQDCLMPLFGYEDADSLLLEQFKVIPRGISKEQFNNSSPSLKLVILGHSSTALELSTLDSEIDLLMVELEYLKRHNKRISDYSSMRTIECDSPSKIKRMIDLGLTVIDDPGFLDDLLYDLLELCGKIEDGSEDASLTGRRNFKFSLEQATQSILLPVIALFEERVRQCNSLLRLMKKGRASITDMQLLAQMCFVVSKVAFMCRAALEGAGWERTQSLLLSLYQLVICFLRFTIRHNPERDVEDLIRSVSSKLTKSVYLLIPVAHQLDHDKFKSVYEFGKAKKGKKGGGNELSKIDLKIAREASRLPRLIFLIESFDCLVVKLSQWRPDITKYIYKSTARDFRIQVEEIEAIMADSDNEEDTPTVQSGPED